MCHVLGLAGGRVEHAVGNVRGEVVRLAARKGALGGVGGVALVEGRDERRAVREDGDQCTCSHDQV